MMVRTALDSFVDCNVEKARQVLQTDDFVDQLNVEIIRHLKEVMQADSQSVEPALHCFSASRHLERIADHATNIAEDVIYLADGEIVRHQHERDKLAESDSF